MTLSDDRLRTIAAEHGHEDMHTAGLRIARAIATEAYRAGLEAAATYLQEHGESCSTCCRCTCGDKEIAKLRALARGHKGQKGYDDGR